MKRISLNANQLKLLAITAMLLDHAVALFMPAGVLRIVLRSIGRLAAPIMCYMIAEGYHHTSNCTKYLSRLLLFALISHLPYNLCMGYSLSPLKATSVIWALAMGLLALMIIKNQKIHWIFRIAGMGACCLLAYTANWNYIAVLWVVFFGIFYGQPKKQMLSFAVIGTVLHLGQQFAPVLLDSIPLASFKNWHQLGIFLVIPLLLLYNGTLGKKSKFLSCFFYWFYPLHLLALHLLDRYLF